MPLSFPILRYNEIISILTNLDCPITQDSLKNPTEGIVLRIYEKFVEITMGMTHDMLLSLDVNAHDSVTHKEVNNFARFGLIRCIMRLMHISGIQDFSLQDIVKPDGNRTKKNISGVVNFIKYREQCLAPFDEKLQHMNEISNQVISLQSQQDKTQKQKEYVYKQCQGDLQIVESLEHEIEELKSEVEVLVNRESVVQGERLKYKNSIDTYKGEILQIEEEIECLIHEVNGAASQIIRSPQKLRHAVNVSAAAVERDKVLVSEQKQNISLKKAQLMECEKVSSHQQDEYDILQQCELDIKRTKQMHKANQDIQLTLHQLQEEIAKLHSQEKHYEQELINIDEHQYLKAKRLMKTKLESEQVLAEVSSIRTNVQKSKAQDREKLHSIDKSITEITRGMQQETRSHQELVRKSKAMCDMYKQTIEAYYASQKRELK